jgi:serine/threonine protein phosphatase PrpC
METLMRFDYAARALLGARDEQEDALAVWTDRETPRFDEAVEGAAGALLVGLADGMGGMAAGGIASKVACASFMAALQRSTGETRLRLEEAALEANDAIQDAKDEDTELQSMGCTMLGLAFGDGALHWVSAGDTHVFLLRGRELLLLNADQSGKPVLEKIAAGGDITKTQAQNDRNNDYLYAALTGGITGEFDRAP